MKAVSATNPVEELLRWWEHPAQMVREVFGAEPDPFQEETLERFPHEPRIALSASKGPGKTTTLAWLGWNFLLTRPDPKIVAASITGDNLADGLWTEMAKWQSKSKLLSSTFTWTKTKIFSNDHPATWWMSARSWSKTANAQEQSDTLAGLHGDYVMVLLDESGAMPPSLIVAADAIFAGTKEAHVVQAGNTITTAGALYFSCITHRDKWRVIRISGDPDDPKRSTRVPLDWAKEQIAMFGVDNPWVQINVLGQFPTQAVNTLISLEDVAAAMARPEVYDRSAPKLLGVDVARQGDDRSVIARRQGVMALPMIVLRNINSLDGAREVARVWREWKADACFIDMTGGFGAGWFDQLRVLGRRAIQVHYSGEAKNKKRYFNRRAEMYMDLADWVRAGGVLPSSPELTAALTNTGYYFKGDRLILEPKELVKQKIGFSPDDADALAETFAETVIPQQQSMGATICKGVDAYHWGM